MGRAQSLNAAGIGRVAHGTRDIRTMADMAQSGRCGSTRTAGGSTRCQGRVMGIKRRAMLLVGGKPAIGKGRCVGAANHNRALAAHVAQKRAVLGCDQIGGQRRAIGGGVARLIGDDLDRDRDARQGTDRVPGLDAGIKQLCLLHGVICAILNDGVDGRIDPRHTIKHLANDRGGAYFAAFDAAGQFAGRQGIRIAGHVGRYLMGLS